MQFDREFAHCDFLKRDFFPDTYLGRKGFQT